ncbi:ribosome silencing factor [Hydrogenophaga taeniospiralis]|uniref:ribosome silencing factor n=1 Tax=Hydrogenophaga taeniospiralis TaxID=65656 RepID=UPI001CFAA4BD|nr:ribosome silencing factor [Hydrogenophaga taeniospiralis]MCB4365195.1 ribosome silencing factor [Hydrogenophaga taeniospiralis]
MTSETTGKKDIQKLQRAIVDGLEDVKGQDIVVFNTEHLSPLFERVIVASGTSNRQTKALAASVRDAVREAGFDKPRIEGEDNGEWIIVDCGAAVAHVMQPVIRQYYRLEEIWGSKPVRLKHGAEKAAEAKPATKTAAKTTKKVAAKEVKPIDAKSVARKAAKAASAAVVAAPAKAGAKTATRATGKAAVKTATKPASRKTATSAAPAKTPLKTVVVKPKSATRPAAKSATKPAVKRAPAAKTVAKAAPKKKA